MFYNIQRLIDGDEIELYSLGEITKSPKLLNRFKKDCNYFVNSQYVAIQGGLSVQLPEFSGNESYTPGYYKGLFNLYKFNEKELIDNFIFEAKTDSTLEVNQLSDRKRAIFSNYFSNIKTAIENETKARYSLTGEIPIQFLK